MLVFVENVLWLLVLIGVMINIHELGHFWAARYFDVKVEAFSFGFGHAPVRIPEGGNGLPVFTDSAGRIREDDRRTGRR